MTSIPEKAAHAVSPSAANQMPLKALRAHPHLYEINTWAWLDRLSASQGRKITLGSAPDSEWDRLQQLGFDVVYLMGVWKRSPAGRTIARSLPGLFAGYDAALPNGTIQDVVGSAFSIQAYEVDERIGSIAELVSLREKLHARGMRLILDFVPNHTGLDHRWVREHPDYYIQGALQDFERAPRDFYLSEENGNTHFIAHGRDPYFPPWTDTAQLNYFNPRLRLAILAELGRIAQLCDGVRCDMAMLLLNDIFARTWNSQLENWPAPQEEFWREATAALPDFIWLAEAYWGTEARLQQLGFDFTYDKVFYDRLRERAIPEIKQHLQHDPLEFQGRSARFIENHDEARSAQLFGARLPAVAALMATITGMRFYYEGQFDGRRIKIPVQLAHAQEEAPDPGTRILYEKILSIANSPAFHEGRWTLLDVQPDRDRTHENLIAYSWQHPAGRDHLVVVNLGAGTSTGRIFLPESMLPAAEINLADEFNGQTYRRLASEIAQNGLFIMLGENAIHMFRILAAEESAGAHPF